ncbi:MAG: T9SS type A sorting domain-containing protein, partial [Ignavibacteriae bacterium]|nr:T9SS type A sorting domain-containing protein [Ignavibacteriota bacterium]
PGLHKRNDIPASGFVAPSVAIYKYTPMGGSLEKRPAFVYSGVGPNSMYYDQENLPTGISNNNGNATDYRLSQNYPNPFNPTTKIDFAILRGSNVKLTVYDMLGREVTTLVNKFLSSGTYTVDFDGANLSSGVYFYRIEVENNFSDIKKMILVK